MSSDQLVLMGSLGLGLVLNSLAQPLMAFSCGQNDLFHVLWVSYCCPSLILEKPGKMYLFPLRLKYKNLG